MRTSFTALMAIVAFGAFSEPSFAADDPPRAKDIMIGGQPQTSQPLGGNSENCVEVEIGGDKVYNCLNEKLKRQSGSVVPVPNIPPIDARSPDIKLGIVNIPAVKQQYGQNFGKSVIPYRPQVPVYSSPVRPR